VDSVPVSVAPELPMVTALTAEAIMVPELVTAPTASEVKVPTDVMLVWAAVDMVPVNVAPELPMVPALTVVPVNAVAVKLPLLFLTGVVNAVLAVVWYPELVVPAVSTIPLLK
jgi:hypothetical protein